MRTELSIVLTAWLLAGCAVTAADPIRVDFTLKQSDDYGKLMAGAYSGSWSVDIGAIEPGVRLDDVFEGRRLRSLEFEWLGRTWTPKNARLAWLEFDEDGKLRSWIIGGTLVSGGCGKVGNLDCVGHPTDAADFYLVASRPERGSRTPPLLAVGVAPDVQGFIEARGHFSVRNEPAGDSSSSRGE